MRVLVIGSTGLLGQALIKEAKLRGIEAIGVALSNADFNLDITDDRALEGLIRNQKPDVIINTVAIVNINLCDEKPGQAYLVNARPAGVLAKISAEIDCSFIHISTDHYYQGDGDQQHLESDPITLINEYARTKYLGEILALQNPKALVVRTNILGFRGWQGEPTFLEWVFEALQTGKKITLFPDYFTSSIHTPQLATILFDLIRHKPYGVLNVASRQVFSKAEFVSTLAKKFGYSLENAQTGSVRELANPRAESLGLNIEKAEALLGYALPTLSEVIDSIAQHRELKQ